MSRAIVNAKEPETANVPDKDWTEEQWSEYKEALAAQLPAGKRAVYFTLDDKPMTEIDVYQSAFFSTDCEIASTDAVKVEAVEGFPGVYALDPSIKDKANEVYLYPKGETRTHSYLWKAWWHSSFLTDDFFNRKSLFTVKYEQAEIDCRILPEEEIVESGERPQAKTHVNGYNESEYQIDGYLFRGWADEGENEVISKVTKPVVLHPVYIDEDAEVGKYEYLSYGNRYGAWNEWREDNKAVTVPVTTAEELADAITDGNATFVAISGDITLDEKVLGDRRRFYLDKDCILIKKGGRLTIQNIQIYREYGMYDNAGKITVQSGGELVIANGDARYFPIAVQKGGKLTVKGAFLELDDLYNYGTITGLLADDGDNYPTRWIEMRNGFFNGKSGTIDLRDDLCIRMNGRLYQEFMNVNRGMINIYDSARLMVENQSDTQNNDPMKLTPFVNDGTILINSKPVKNLEQYYGYGLRIDYSRMLNNGTIKIDPAGVNELLNTPGYPQYNYYLTVNSSEFVNAGSLDVTFVDTSCIVVRGTFLDPDSFGTTTKETKKIYASFTNLADGKVNITTKEPTCAFRIERDSTLVNAGVMTINTDKDSINEASIECWGGIRNTGTMNGNGSVGYLGSYYSSDAVKDCPFSEGTIGLPTRFGYRIIAVEDTEYGNQIEDCTVKIGGQELARQDGEFIAYLDAGKDCAVEITGSGYKPYSGQYKADGTVQEYRERDRYYVYFKLNRAENQGMAPTTEKPTATTGGTQTTKTDGAQTTASGQTSTAVSGKKSKAVVKIKVSSAVCKKNTKKITGKLSVSGATVKIKVGNKAYKKAKVKGKKFTLKLSYKLKKKTRIIIKVTKKNCKGITKTYKVK